MMQSHERVSNNIEEKSFACQTCWRRFARETDLKTHVWTHTQSSNQEKSTIYSCDLCHRAFPCATTLNNHFKRTHKDVSLSPQTVVVSSPLPVATPPPSSQLQVVQQRVGSPQLQQQHVVSTSQQLTIATSEGGGGGGVRELSGQQQQQHHHHHHHLDISPDSAARKNSPPCGVCGKKFAFKYYVKIHQTVHTKEKPYICDLCHKTFSQASSRNRHRKEMHKEGTEIQQQNGSSGGGGGGGTNLQLQISDNSENKIVSQFDVLGKQFSPNRGGSALYEVHPVTETKEKPYICDLCHKRFTQASSRNRHLKEMHKDGDTPLPPGESPPGTRRAVGVLTRNVGPSCHVCSKRFPCKSLLEIHMRVHTKERPYSCEICFKTFTQVSSRNFHRRKMHKDLILNLLPPPTQEQQQQQEQQQLALKQTTLVESGGKLVPECGVCGKRFPCKSLMEIHMRVHTKERPYSCDLCFKTFTQVSSRNFHRRKIHKEQISSPNSQNSSSSQSSLPQVQQQQQQPSSLGLTSCPPKPPSTPILQDCHHKMMQQSNQQQQEQNLTQLTQLQNLQSQIAQQQQQQQQTQNAQQNQISLQQQQNTVAILPMSPLSQQQQQCHGQLTHHAQHHRQSPLSPQQRQSPTSQVPNPQLSPSPNTQQQVQQQRVNLHQHSHSHVNLHQGASPSQQGQALLGDPDGKSFHCKMCATTSSFNYK